MKGSGFKCLRE